ncbi:MAG: efflux RND transporter periplasmic adaptor subunit [Negativicutes bacterium]|nr:efflux RND transporter periplasmic adaptor subunit [Negativicutes bacterium]
MKGFKAKYWVVPVMLAVGLTVAAKSYFLPAGKAQNQLSENNAVSVTAAEVSYINKLPKLVLTGSLEAQTSAAISAKISGRIQEVLVEDGQMVRAGQPLVKLESAELANSARMANDTVRKAQASYDNAKADYDRYRALFEQNAVSRQQLDSIETKLRIAEADLSSATASASNAQQQYGHSVIFAPVSGVVANKTATIGQVVAPGVALMTVEDIGTLYAVVNIEQKDMGMVAIGQTAAIMVDTYPGKVFAGTVDTINPVAGLNSRMFRTKIKLDNADGLLKPGMFIKVELVTGAETKTLAVPQSAVFQKQGLAYVYAIENGKAVRRQVEVGEVNGNNIEIKAGLQGKQLVAVNNVTKLKDGDAVAVTK